MATQAQIDANRANAQKSTGPRTPEGKRRSRENALRHGLCGTAILMHSEAEDEFNEMLDDLLDEWQPATHTERMVFYKMVEQYWLSRRATTLLAEHTEYLDGKDAEPEDARNVSLFLRYNQTGMRGFFRSLNELVRLQKNRAQIQQNQTADSGIGFVSQPDPEPAPATVQEPVSMPVVAVPQPPIRAYSPLGFPIPPNRAA